jgi:hypothetical protein
MAVFATSYGGLTTPGTPTPVGYYLDQAHMAQSVGANSAAVAMYRAALEHLLFKQGYKQRMLGPKIKALVADIEKGEAEQWAIGLDPEVLRVIKELGDHSIHPNDGEIAMQEKIDAELLGHLRAAFLLILNDVYEIPAKRARLRDDLKASLADVKGGGVKETPGTESESA